MTAADFRLALAYLNLRQIDFAQLLGHLWGKTPNPAHVNRWATGARAVPSSTIVILGLLGMLTPTTRQKLYLDAGIKIRYV